LRIYRIFEERQVKRLERLEKLKENIFFTYVKKLNVKFFLIKQQQQKYANVYVKLKN